MSNENGLPQGWTSATVADLVVDGPTNGYSGETGPGGTPTLKLSATTQGEMILNEETTKTLVETIDQSSKFWLEPGDLLVQRANSLQYLGAAAIYEGPARQYVYPDLMMRLRVSEDATRKYLWRFFNSQKCRAHFQSKATGTAGNMPKISGSILKATSVPLPPLSEQRRIVAKIDALQARSRRARAALDAIPALLDRFRQSVLAAAFRGDLTADWRAAHPDAEPAATMAARIPTPPRPKRYQSRSPAVMPGDYGMSIGHPGTPTPKGWAWLPLVDLARLETGHTPSRSRPEWWDGSIPWIGLRDASAHHGQTILDTRQHTNDEGLANSAARLLPAGTVCLSRTGTIGWVVVMGREMATSQDFVNWVCTEAIDPQWLKFLFMAENRALWSFSNQTTNIPTIYFPEAISFHVCLPPLAEQQEIVRKVEQRMRFIDSVEVALRPCQDRIAVLDQSILAKAFRGELVPQDPNDEPASVLLERIRAVGAAQARRTARRKK